MLKSLDPRVNRLPEIGALPEASRKASLDQLGTFEVFVQPRTGKPFQHEGAVHAPDLEMAFVLAKETFTRRFTCASLCVVDTRNVYVSAMTEGDVNVYDSFSIPPADQSPEMSFEVFELYKRGKQHIHTGTVTASSPHHAMAKGRALTKPNAVVYNVWAIPTSTIRFTSEEEQDLWNTLPEKKFRDAAEYKGGERLKSFLEKTQQVHKMP